MNIVANLRKNLLMDSVIVVWCTWKKGYTQGVKGRSGGVGVYKFLNIIITMRLEFLAWLRAVSEMFNYMGISIAEFWKLVTITFLQYGA